MTLPAGSRSSIPLDQLVVLNDEMAALVRAGIPLGQGLMDVSAELPGHSGRLAAELARRLDSGQTLEQVLTRDSAIFPPMWRAVVLAGIRSGNLTAALEEIASTTRRAADLRRGLRAGLVYPSVVVILAFCSFILLTTFVVPMMVRANADLGTPSGQVVNLLQWLGERALWWGIGVPILVLLAFMVLRAALTTTGRRRASVGRTRPWRLFPSPLSNGRLAIFADVLAMLLRHEIPLTEALALAGDASGDPRLVHSATILAERISRGEVVASSDAAKLGLPPLLAWLLSTNRQSAGSVSALVQFADQRRQQAVQQAAMAVSILPVAITATIGGAFTLVYALALFWPLSNMLFDLGGTPK